MRWPLRRQILLPMVGILLLTMGGASALQAWQAWRLEQARLEARLAAVARTLSATNFPLESGVLRQAGGLTGAEYVVTDLSGELIATSDAELSTLKGPARQVAGGFDLHAPVAAGVRQYFRATVPLDRRAVGGGCYWLQVYYPVESWREARWQATWPPLAIGGAALALVGVAAYAIARQVTRPLESLRSQVDRIAAGDFQPLATPRRDDELRQLAAAVNQMALTLARYETEIRRSERLRTLGTLGGGIAHQVRNAATGCRIALDLHQRDCPLPAADGADEPLAVAVRQLELIETYIQRLLALGRPTAAARQRVDLADIVTEAAALVRPMAEHVGVGVESSLPEKPLIVSADAVALGQLLVNLLLNGVQATAALQVAALGSGGAPRPEVTLAAESVAADRARLVISDPGPGPAAELCDRLFEPVATDKPGGTGRGLVVVRQIAEDHGGTIRWERRGERTNFIVELPLATAGAG
ncbi:MAG: HAMP domain-containing sensor histidine kinase [Pirellulaceae bacterium]|nr:HAMP domain-containing sensor histidine kinase [Pirellulaceae bacterium]